MESSLYLFVQLIFIKDRTRNQPSEFDAHLLHSIRACCLKLYNTVKTLQCNTPPCNENIRNNLEISKLKMTSYIHLTFSNPSVHSFSITFQQLITNLELEMVL